VPMFAGAHEPQTKSKLPIAIAAAVILAVVGGGAWMMMGRNSAQPATTTSTNAQMIPTAAPAPKQILPEPILASGSTTTSTSTAPATTSAGDAAAQKRAFEEAVRQKLQSEMSKLNEQYMSELQRQQSRNAPVAAPAAVTSAPAQEDRGPGSAAQLDQQRREAARQEDVAETRAPAPVPTQTVAQQQPSAPAPVPTPAVTAPSTVREGDVVLYSALDAPPRATRRINAVYPPAARQQRIAGTVILSALIDENGVVTDVKVLRGVGRMGVDESAIRAMRGARFTPPMKDGKRVKTWWPQTIQFEP
jgi:TonB family protein